MMLKACLIFPEASNVMLKGFNPRISELDGGGGVRRGGGLQRLGVQLHR